MSELEATDPVFLLIHGSAHGAWCWRDLIPALVARGGIVHAMDLPSHGADTTPYFEVTLDLYRDAILHKIAEIGTPVILVGHSAGGYAITAAAEAAPECVAQMIYVCAYVPEDGKSLGDMRRSARAHPVLAAIAKTPDDKAFTFRADTVVATLFHDCPAQAVAYALPHLGPQAIRPQETPLTITARSATLPRDYVLCTDDRTIPPEEQEKMVKDWPEDQVHRLTAGHSPYFSHPDSLADLLIKAVRKDG
ncbi:alpha/beta fold hydrolase [Celeribacter baekdonensis]|uniref:Esterase n=1 Tax=Celeribacter baekdonensis TaxID=875171 RepID=A0A2R4M893_9RHOB|nr:alpha/beta fold hydrolase [Celeribacter baekdonensis]AVW90229.1 esterase [Celeribacter baekdonensis]AVW93279.1 esterase [Celeribacter baekdonensis]